MEWIETFFQYLTATYSVRTVIIMAAFMSIIMFVLNYVKIPIKMLTAKITDERLRKLANKSIIILSFCISIGLWFTLHAILPEIIKINWVEIVCTGFAPVVVYAIFDGVLTANSAKSIVYTIKEVSADGKITLQEAARVAKELGEIFDADIIEKSQEKGKEPYFETEVEEKKVEEPVKTVKIVATEQNRDDFSALLNSLK